MAMAMAGTLQSLSAVKLGRVGDAHAELWKLKGKGSSCSFSSSCSSLASEQTLLPLIKSPSHPVVIKQQERPDELGKFGKYGGRYVPEILVHPLSELESAFHMLKSEEAFQQELNGLLKDYAGRESPLYFAERLSEHYGGPHIYLKREDLNHTGSYTINNAIGQALLAKRMGKKRVIAETGGGQHGAATAAACARLGLQCVVYMGGHDMDRQASNVFEMRLLGAEVRGVHSPSASGSGSATLKDATSEAIRDSVNNMESSHHIMGSVVGPHPYPTIVREFNAVIGRETRRQGMEKWGGKPDVLVACVGRGSNAMGLFDEFVEDEEVRLIGVEGAGSPSLTMGEVGVMHGSMSYLLQDEDGQIVEPAYSSIAAGMNYPGVGAEHSFLKDIGRAHYHSVTDEEALNAFHLLCRLEGIIPALETAHALAFLQNCALPFPTEPRWYSIVAAEETRMFIIQELLNIS